MFIKYQKMRKDLILNEGCGCQQWPLLRGGWKWWTFPHPGEILISFRCCFVCIASCRVFQRRWRSWSLRMCWWLALLPTWPSMCSGTQRKRIRYIKVFHLCPLKTMMSLCINGHRVEIFSNIEPIFRKKWKNLTLWIKPTWSTRRRGKSRGNHFQLI